MAGESDKTYTQAELEALIEEKVAGLKANQAQLIKEAKDAKAAIKNYDGVDPDEFRRLKTASEDAERKRLAGEGDWKSLEKQLNERHTSAEQGWKSRESKLLSALEQNLIDAAVATELAKHSDNPTLLLPHIRGRMKVLEQDGNFVARIVDEAGNVRIGKGQGSAPMTLPELIEDMKTDKSYAPAFRGTGSSGGGASRSPAGGGGSAVIPSTNSPEFLAALKAVASGEAQVGGT